MSSSTDQDFTQLRRLLRLKQHEQPPPGYFDFLAGSVKTALTREHASLRVEARPATPLRRLVGFLETFQTRPAFTVGLAGVVCALLVGFVVLSESDDVLGPPLAPGLTAGTAMPAMGDPVSDLAGNPAVAPFTPVLASNAPLGNSLFDLIQPVTIMPAGMHR